VKTYKFKLVTCPLESPRLPSLLAWIRPWSSPLDLRRCNCAYLFVYAASRCFLVALVVGLPLQFLPLRPIPIVGTDLVVASNWLYMVFISAVGIWKHKNARNCILLEDDED
jgi:hypothetical protein